MADKTYNGIQFPNKSSGQGRTPDSGFLRVYLKNGNIHVVDENSNDTQLTGIAESDPVFMSSAASGITNTNISNWNTAYSWGDHATQNYLTSVALNDISNVTITTPSSGQVLAYNGSIWVNDTLVSDASVSASATAPTAPAEGTLWWDVDIGQLFIYYNDGTSNQWVEAAPAISPFEYNSSTQTYSVSGTINATAFTGDGSALTGISVSTFDGQNSAYYLDYGNFSNVPTAVSAFTNDAGYATETYVGTQISNLVAAAPATLDTLNELAAALGDDPNFATTVTNSLSNKLENINNENIEDLNNVSITTPSNGEVLKYNGTNWVNSADAGGISLNDLSVDPDAAASGSGGITYDDTTGVFTYTPPDLSLYATTASLATIATTGAYGDLANPPTIPSDIADLTDTTSLLFDGTYSSLSGAPTAVSAFTNDAGYITDYTVTQTDVTTHQGALSITESQISDLGSYLTQTTGDARYLQLSGGSITGNISLGDTVEARFGAGSGSGYDFRIYHNGASYIENTNTHSMIFRNVSNNENYIVATPSGAVTLYHNGLPKIATATDGISVSGDIAVTGTVDGRDLSADGTKLDGIETGADVTDANNVDPLVDAHLNTSTATTDQVLSWNGSDYDWVDQSGGTGGASALNDLTDVTIASVADGDLLRYNGTASEWQNTNLGLTVTPTLSAASTQYLSGTATITNWGTYQNPAVFVQLKNSGGTVVVTNDNITVDNSGNILFDLPSTTGTYTLEVQVQDFGDLASEVGTVNITKASADFRYWRITDFVFAASSGVYIRDLRFYTAAAQSGTAYPANMTLNTSPAPYVASGVGQFNSTYDPWKAFDSSLSGGWWNLGSPQFTDYLQIDMGSSIAIASLAIQFANTYTPISCVIYGSNTGAFAGEEIDVLNFSNSFPSSSFSGNEVFNIG